ncbi:hypothetical protein [Campylobacter vicugnae]|uniref:hypothetical protein n=1 Tax=Campylobacter vicugnae TaxID=1660076 RepID=UPI002550F01B|nr:hypothetical protein [Campylobacter ovis]MDL0096162.1 hypothetical protein [Campylobacter ovis]
MLLNFLNFLNINKNSNKSNNKKDIKSIKNNHIIDDEEQVYKTYEKEPIIVTDGIKEVTIKEVVEIIPIGNKKSKQNIKKTVTQRLK